MKVRLLIAVLGMMLAAPPAVAVTPASELFLVSVGRAQGACPGGICAQWRTDVWLFSPLPDVSGTVRIEFLRRGQANLTPAFAEVELQPGQTIQLRDVVGDPLNQDGRFGALRVVAPGPVVLTGRVYDENVVTNKGAGTAGQFYAGMPAGAAVGLGQETDIVGLAHGEVWRSNLALVETAGHEVSLVVERLDAEGVLLGARSYELRPREALQINNVLPALGAGDTVENQRVRVRVTGGSGRVLAAGSIIDNRTGDPSTVEMVVPAGQPGGDGLYEGVVRSEDGTLLDGALALYVDDDRIHDVAFNIGLDCGEMGWISVDLWPEDAPLDPVVLGPGGEFDLSFSQEPYGLFLVTVTMSGAFSTAGPFVGAIETAVSGGTGEWAACNLTTTRPWRAAWTAPF